MPRLLDLFCGAGGAAMGYHRAGFEVVGVDLHPRPRFPFEFHRADALTFDLAGFDVIHASPPCQRFSTMTGRWGRNDEHPDLIGPIRARLEWWGGPYVIENVPGAPLSDPLTLCGSQFGLALRRHRCFESNVPLVDAGPHDHTRPVVGVYGQTGGSSVRDGVKFDTIRARRDAMGIQWMTNRELVEAIPPVYSEHLGRQLLAHLSDHSLS